MTNKVNLKIFLFIFLLAFIPFFVQAEDDCPFGVKNDPAPGQCALYEDKNDNGFCDHGEVADIDGNQISDKQDLISGQDMKARTVEEVAKIYNISSDLYAENLSNYLGAIVGKTYSFQVLHDRYRLAPSVAKDIAFGLSQGKIISYDDDQPKKKNKAKYSFVLIAIVLIILYLASSFLEKKKYLTVFNHHRIWNVLLLFVFLITAVMGVMLVLAINFGWFLSWYSFLLYWHVEVGSAMIIVTFFHLSWHWRYYTALLKVQKIDKNSNK